LRPFRLQKYKKKRILQNILIFIVTFRYFFVPLHDFCSAKLMKLRNLITILAFLPMGMFATIAKPGTGLVGDEFMHYREGEQPPVMQDSPEYESIRRLPGIQRGSFPTKGEIRSIVILVNFSDRSFVIPDANAAFTRMLNTSGYSENNGTGSARDYFIASSDSLFKPIFDVYGPYTVSKQMSYYGGNGATGSDQRPSQMITEACELAEAAGVDFAKYDVDNDGTVDNVFVYYAGYNEAEGGPATSIWPHRSRIVNSREYSGKTLSDYACTSELTGRSGSNMCGIGTFCHEFSHVLGLPDLYNTKSSSTYTVGAWDIMASGNYNNSGRTPPAYSAFERFMLGWLTPEQLSNSSDYTLSPLEQTNRAWLIATEQHTLDPANIKPREFWLIENRQHVGWDTPDGAIPGVGLLITHISHTPSKWSNNTYNNGTPLGYDVCEAYYKNPHSASPSDTYPGEKEITYFLPTNNNAEPLVEHTVSNIRYLQGTEIVFHYGESSGYGFTLTPRSLPTIVTDMLDDDYTYHIDSVHVSGEHLSGREVLLAQTNKLFQLSINKRTWDYQFVQALTSDSTFDRTVYIRHLPSRNCTSSTGMLAIYTDDGAFSTQLTLQGYSQRPTLITPVETWPAEEITPYSFVARWLNQKDAEFYYLSLYRLEEGTTTMKPSLSTTNFAAEGDIAITDIYPTYAAALHLSVSHSFLGDETNGGVLVIEGKSNSSTWSPIDSLVFRPISPNRDYDWNFTALPVYTQFRFRYHHLGGAGSVTLTQCTITLNSKLEKIYSDDEYMLYAPLDEAQISGLKPNTEYSYQLTAMEEKGCERHFTTLGEPAIVRTLEGASDTEKNLTVYVTPDKQVIVYLPVIPAPEDHLLVFGTDGNLVVDVSLQDILYHAYIPTTNLTYGNIYCLQFVHPDSDSDSAPLRLSRKARWAKFLYR